MYSTLNVCSYALIDAYSDLDEEVANVLFQLVDILIEAEHAVDKYLDLSAITDTKKSNNNETHSIY